MEVVVNGQVQVIEVGADAYEVVVNQSPVQVLTVGQQGPAGPQGPPGPAGETYVWDQGTPSTTWSITHPLNTFPQVTVVDSGGNKVYGTIQYTGLNTMVIEFSVAFGGKAYLS